MSKKTPSVIAKFAHLFNISAASDDNQDEDDPSKQRADESDESYAERMEEEERKQGDDESDEDYKKRMEAMDEEEDSDEAANEAADDDDGAGESTKEQAARQRERKRISRIFEHPSAASRMDMAAHLAFETNMTAGAARNTLQVSAKTPPQKTKPSSLGSRMSGVHVKNPGSGTALEKNDGKAKVAAGMLAVFQASRGIK
jgi:hypothetical protein